MSKCFFALTRAFTTCSDEAGSTFVSISGTMIRALPFRRQALSTFEDAVRKTGVAEVLEGDVVESLRAIAGAHAVDLDDDEAQLGQGVHSGGRGESLGHEGALRSRVYVLDHRILLRGIEVTRTHDNS